MSKVTFKLFACCIPVRGARRSTLCDLQRQTYRFIPNALYEILVEYEGKTCDELEEVYGPGSRPILDDYFRFLVDNEFGFWCDEFESFPPLDLLWARPERISNAIIDVGENSRHDYLSLVRQLDVLGCPALQYRFFCPVSCEELETALEPTYVSRLRSIDLLLRYDAVWDVPTVEALCLRHQRISQVFVHSAPEECSVRVKGIGTRIFYQTQHVDSSAHCGFVHPRYFALTLEAFTEAQTYNSCLNRKLSIDTEGMIRNCPAMSRSFGHASHTPLSDVLSQPEFREVWGITKDQIKICQHCEFRYVCTDCRALLSVSSDPLSKPLRCGYDPFTATWSEEQESVPAPLADGLPGRRPGGSSIEPETAEHLRQAYLRE